MTELALMFASRAQHLREVILPAVEAGGIVLCDRFTDSSEAYQGGGRSLGSQTVLDLHRVLCGDVRPDLTILMDCDVSVSVDRARRRNRERAASVDESRFERENRAFFARAHAAYQEIARREPQRVAVVDARGTPEQTHATILAVVNNKLGIAGSRRIQNAG
jgi:dTMP kinase